jgi:chemotaxis protein CheD
MPEKEWAVGIAEVKTARSPDRLTAYGLGSCVGISLYDRQNKIGGMAHVMLPSSQLYSRTAVPGKYADTAIESLLKALLEEGANLTALEAKLVGGANMFASIIPQAVPIGMRNVSASRDKLLEKGIPVLAEEVGGSQGRTVFFSLLDGRMEIRKLNQPVQWI